MAFQVTSKTLQYQPSQSYYPECKGDCSGTKGRKPANDTDKGCACGHCSLSTSWKPCDKTGNKQDWKYKDKKCCWGSGVCPHKPSCSKPDINVCDIFADGSNAAIAVEWLEDGGDNITPNAGIRCTYDQSKIVTDDLSASLVRINKWKDKFITNPLVQDDDNAKATYDQMMTDLCSRQTTDSCMAQPFDQAGRMSQCSILNSFSDTGRAARQWFDAQPDNVRDNIMKNYCLKFNTSECACINRDQYPMYKEISGALTKNTYNYIADSCWWTGCKDADIFFVPSNEIAKPGTCPANICETINNFTDNNIDQSTFNAQTTCIYNTGGGTVNTGGGKSKINWFDWKEWQEQAKENPKQVSAVLMVLSAVFILLAAL